MGNLSGRIIKAMGIFGGTQLAVIAFGIVRNKFLAMLLGPAGVGLNAVFISTQELIKSAAGLNLRTSGVRELSAATGALRAHRAGMLAKIALLLALAGAAATLLLSPALSLWSLGSTAQWWCFALLSAGVGAAIYLDADLAALQAEGALKALARVTLASSALTTAVAIPLYYLTGMQAVLPVYLLMTVSYALWARRERRRHCPPPARVGTREAWKAAGPMLRLGLYLTVATVAGRLCDYGFMLFITNTASASELGLFQAGNTIINNYVAVIFTAITAEYYPRLASVGNSPMRTQAFAGGEFKIMAWVLMPVAVLFTVVSGPVVNLLYADSFMPAAGYVDLGMCSMLPRAMGYCIGFVILARGDGRTYVCTETISALLGLGLRAGGFMLWGLDGAGAAAIAHSGLYCLIVGYAYRSYGMRHSRGIVALAVSGTMLCLLCVAAKNLAGWWLPAAAVLPWLIPVAWRQVFGKLRRQGARNPRECGTD